MQDSILQLLTNRIFLSALFSWFIAQVFKAFIDLLVKKNVPKTETALPNSFVGVWKTGGMPSSHSSMTCGLTTAFGFTDGLTSTGFLVSLCFTTIVLRDACGIRLSVGKLAERHNALIDMLNESRQEEPLQKIQVAEGHTLMEVAVGCILGIFIATSIFLI